MTKKLVLVIGGTGAQGIPVVKCTAIILSQLDLSNIDRSFDIRQQILRPGYN